MVAGKSCCVRCCSRAKTKRPPGCLTKAGRLSHNASLDTFTAVFLILFYELRYHGHLAFARNSPVTQPCRQFNISEYFFVLIEGGTTNDQISNTKEVLQEKSSVIRFECAQSDSPISCTMNKTVQVFGVSFFCRILRPFHRNATQGRSCAT